MDFEQLFNGNINQFQTLLQKIMTDENQKKFINLFDCFNIYFIQSRNQIMKILSHRAKLFDDGDFLIYKSTEKDKYLRDTENANISVHKTSLESIMTDSFCFYDIKIELPLNYKLEYLHQFLKNKKTLTGYTTVKFDILIERNSLQWTLMGFQQSDKNNFHELKIIMESFKKLNKYENVLSFQEFSKLFFEPLESKKISYENPLNQNFWNLDFKIEIQNRSEWDCRGQAIQKINSNLMKFEFKKNKDHLYLSNK